MVDNRTLSGSSKVSHLQICLWDQNSHSNFFLWFPSTALTELEELNLDRTLITDDGCTVLSCKYYLLSGQIVSSENLHIKTFTFNSLIYFRFVFWPTQVLDTFVFLVYHPQE